MNKSLNMRELRERIISFENILIITHINPDPDTLGSALGLKKIFNKLNKTSHIVCATKVNERVCGYFGVTPELDAHAAESSGFKPERVICVDAAALDQIGSYADSKIDLVIDHHVTNTFYGRETYLDAGAAATGEIIFELAKAFGFEIGEIDEIDKDFARDIYCAVISDSGSFRYATTTPKTLTAAAELISTGFDFAGLNRLIYQNKSITQIALERLAYNSLKFTLGGKAAFIIITREMKKAAGLAGVEITGINEIPRTVEGVEVGAVIREADPDEDGESGKAGVFYVSLRSNEYVNVAEIAADFGGGGHIRAAGCTYKGDADVLERELIKKIEKVL